MSDDVPRESSPGAAAGSGWSAYAPVDAAAAAEDDVVVTRLDLTPDEHAGPFRDDEGPLGDDFDELHRWTGISQELYDDAATWNDDATSAPGASPEELTPELFTRRQERLRRLAAEVHLGITMTAWEDEGAAIARDLQGALGHDYEVLPR